MSLKSRLQKIKQNKSAGFAVESNDFDLSGYFRKNSDINVLTVYAHDEIYEEKSGITSKVPLSFTSDTSYLTEVIRICELYEIYPDKENPSAKINMPGGITMSVFISPAVSGEPFVTFTRKPNNTFEDYFSNKLLSSEILLYLKECLDKNVNIFIAGDATTDKTPVMNLLANIMPENKKTIICENGEKMSVSKPCCVKFRQTEKALANIAALQYDRLFCNDSSVKELIKIFELILAGYNGFTASLSLKTGIDTLCALRNMLLMPHPNLSEENADFMITSATDVIINVNKINNGKIRITKISETSKNKMNEVSLKDIFVFGKEDCHISTGNFSRYFNSENSKRFAPEYTEEGRKHQYIGGIIPDAKTKKPLNSNKLRHLKSKLKNKTTELSAFSQTTPAFPEPIIQLIDPKELSSAAHKPTVATISDKQEEIKQPTEETLDIFEENETSTNEPVSEPETDKISDDFVRLNTPGVITPVRNIFDEGEDDTNKNENSYEENDIIPDTEEIESDEEEIIYDEVEENNITEEPELFSEIKDTYISEEIEENITEDAESEKIESDEEEITEIPDEDI